MPSKVLALKYRPKDFSEVVGQETTVQILQNALVQKHLHHAYLFTGPRGIGKTSLARIFSRALNCDKGPTDQPCGQCTSCREVSEGRSLSVIEIDGASNTSVDDVRDLREKIRYLPPGGRYKIYIIDEVHMLSTAAFNALLKTLEEPPPHAIFLFATTEPQKVPATVLSRMIRFDLRPISRSAIIDHLRNIAKVESIPIRDEALFEIAREAQGGLRDALSLLDQIISFSGSEITLASVEGVIGVSTRRFILQMIEAILNQDASKTLLIAEEAFSSGIEVKRLSLDLLEYTRHLLVAQINQDPSLFNLPREEIAHLASLAKQGTADELDRLFRILQRGISELARSPQAKILMDVLLVRVCHFKDLYSTEEILKMASASNPVSKTIPVPPPSSAPVKVPVRESRENKDWPGFVRFLKNKRPQLSSIIENGIFIRQVENEIALSFPPQSIHVSLLEEPDRATLLKTHLAEFFGIPINIRYDSSPSQKTSSGTSPSIVDEAISILGAKPVGPVLREST